MKDWLWNLARLKTLLFAQLRKVDFKLEKFKGLPL
ncbi:hypothetical protein Xen7305DRAFT_00049840 [Xenococcus sp. PCC 7305]|nr:hypothetical protein Xen7305DRAFT_00049840 [Xenococcus sp. PCC 7305]